MKRLIQDVKVPPRTMLVVTPAQHRYIDQEAHRSKVSRSEAVRKIIQKAMDDRDEYKRLLIALSED